MAKYFLIVVLIISGSCASQATYRTFDEGSIAEKFEQWKAQYGRTYKESAENSKRFEIFKDNLVAVERFNNAAIGNRSYTLRLNKFADLTPQEFIASHTGFKMSDHSSSLKANGTPFLYKSSQVPPSVNWIEKGAVTPVKYQGQCGKWIAQFLCILINLYHVAFCN